MRVRRDEQRMLGVRVRVHDALLAGDGVSYAAVLGSVLVVKLSGGGGAGTGRADAVLC